MTKSPLKKTIEWYDKHAEEYAKKVNSLLPFNALNRFIKLLKKHDLILDVGCGFGRDSKFFYENGLKVIGIDLSEGLLKIAKKSYPKINFIKADIRNLPFKDGSFDGVWCSAVLLHLEKLQDVKKALKEMYRVLKKDGVIFISVKKQLGKEKTSFTKDSLIDAKRFFRWFTPKEISDLVSQAGFKIIEMREVQSRSRPGEVVWIQVFAEK